MFQKISRLKTSFPHRFIKTATTTTTTKAFPSFKAGYLLWWKFNRHGASSLHTSGSAEETFILFLLVLFTLLPRTTIYIKAWHLISQIGSCFCHTTSTWYHIINHQSKPCCGYKRHADLYHKSHHENVGLKKVNLQEFELVFQVIRQSCF